MAAASARAIGTLLRLVATSADDVRLLIRNGRLPAAARLLGDAAGWAVVAVAVSERGWPDPAGLDAVPADNPLRPELAALLRACPAVPPVKPNGLPAADADRLGLERGLDALTASVGRLLPQFGVDLEGDQPARNDGPARLEPPAPEPAVPRPRLPDARAPDSRAPDSRAPDFRTPERVPPPVLRPITVVARPPPARAAVRVPPPAALPVPTRPGSVASTVFWSLIDSWAVDDLTALRLVGHGGGLTAKGTRPRFRLDAAEAERLAILCETDAALRSLGLEPREWLVTPVKAPPFLGATPLALLGQPGAARTVSRFVLQQGLRLSMAGKR